MKPRENPKETKLKDIKQEIEEAKSYDNRR